MIGLGDKFYFDRKNAYNGFLQNFLNTRMKYVGKIEHEKAI